ncbi:MAG: 6,7-dimethyl-8-ribityllumazine synthase [Chloroflexi bacterium]|jgi:6,7-dimethyl-8-ribityllumazine synthase|nr:6,7-dimethyl-8-ribityllumazine synthase [Chloroflexota bacterium]MCH2531253.1 6,7-dimethyl-8-ribityllumazine synthase [Dehalococcoidia bacterium]HCH35209.1 6,7-dimethyl-8-ribityllumazine synthase [Dehalococcoidia bacterium]|tara:strand:+ start:5259 stop:5756 length:498 start_codon:yes stop_codon:yes gene_type:complete
MANEIIGNLDGQNLRIGVIVSQFNETITARLLKGAREAADSHGIKEENITIVFVPGSFELPAAASKMLETSNWDAVVALGCVIRGETPHFDLVASESARGISEVSRKFGKPVIFGVLTTNNMDQALARSGGFAGNKGFDSMSTAIKMVGVFDGIEKFTNINGAAE